MRSRQGNAAIVVFLPMILGLESRASIVQDKCDPRPRRPSGTSSTLNKQKSSMEKYIVENVEKNIPNTRLTLLDSIMLKDKAQKLEELFHYRYCLSRNTNNVKFNGRYPFRPLLGATEFFSALFSFGNLVSNLCSYTHFVAPLRSQSVLFGLVKTHMYINILTWAFSTLFHINDTAVTRNLNYFCGFLNICFLLYSGIARHVLEFAADVHVSLFMRPLLLVFLTMYLAHVCYMSLVRFDFVFHKYLCGTLFAMAIASWLHISYMHFPKPHSLYLMVFAGGTLASALIEVTDAPPAFYLVDAHALFHLATMVFTPFYYMFVREDLILNKSISYYLIVSKIQGNSNLAKLNRLAIRSNILTWVFSTIYHYHVCRITRDLDYFFAFLTILMNLYIFLLRLLYVYRQKEAVEVMHRRLRALVAVFYVFHVYSMYFLDFNFRRHKNISSALIGVSILIWFHLARTFKRLPHSRYLLVFATGVCISGMIEMCDIPPLYYLLDSHAVYHFITMFLHPFYYLFIRYDLEYFADTQKARTQGSGTNTRCTALERPGMHKEP
ncbi:UNVERIFIED_CONTAM: hypothetical protein PYX00_011470 [Menopon gallinae]|uniref:Post-GPI attachment to proteins factor 3 n=1 Tax=Menopon gallinae TaxID=328185 RepID=A0AAW2H7R0_9NEOP